MSQLHTFYPPTQAETNMVINTLLYTELEKTVKTFGFEHIDVVQVNAHNFNSRADMENVGVRWYKRHRHYRRPL